LPINDAVVDIDYFYTIKTDYGRLPTKPDEELNKTEPKNYILFNSQDKLHTFLFILQQHNEKMEL
jgi:hypothetical protein